MIFVKKIAGVTLIAALLSGFAYAPAQPATVRVVVNGSTVSFDQPPIERAGRVFVPLRGVFEQLGASVVYSRPDINATGNGRSIHLTIGSTSALINGQTVYMDVAPFLVGARTLVPLRFVAQALGASVNWNASDNTVYIQGSGSASTTTPPVNASFHLINVSPASSANTTSPQIHAGFSEPINRDSLRVSVDGRDVSSLVYTNASGFDVTADFPLASGMHNVRVTGTTQAGLTFDTGWSFTTSNGGETNSITNIAPAPGSRVGSPFTLSGRTLPGSNVHIVATGTQGIFGGIFQVGTGTFQTDLTADAYGNFSVSINVNAVSGGAVRVIVTSVSPGGASAEQNIVYSS